MVLAVAGRRTHHLVGGGNVNFDDWHRADQGDLPEQGQIITMLEFAPETAGVKIWGRMRVEVVLDGTRPGVYGATLPSRADVTENLPERPAEVFGKVLMWREAT